MKTRHDIRNLLDKITRVADGQGLLRLLSTLAPDKVEKPVRVAFVNAHALNIAFKDGEFLRRLAQSDHVFRDGSGMKILYRMLGQDPGLNLNGTDLIPRIARLYAGCGVALMGTRQPHTGRAAQALRRQGLSPVLVMDGFRADRLYLEEARRRPARLIILAMGMPKQERVAELLARNLGYPCLIVCGGAILDFMSGRVARAPLPVRRMGMEWAYRLVLEPRRLMRRYLIGNFVFLYRSVLLASAPRTGP